MTDVFSRNRADIANDWLASLLFAALMGYACWTVGGGKLAAAGAMGGFMVGAGLLAKVSPKARAHATFDLVPFDAAANEEELLLDDPLVEPAAGSRVVKLFSAGESSPALLVARIEDYLGREAVRAPSLAAVDEGPRPTADASAALHAALSNIRASLR